MSAFRRGLLVLAAGASTIRLSPPLMLTREQADIAVAILADAFAEISNS
jgi:4-aminobutyrate aminotransferase